MVNVDECDNTNVDNVVGDPEVTPDNLEPDGASVELVLAPVSPANVPSSLCPDCPLGCS